MADYKGIKEGEEYKPCSLEWISKNKTKANWCPAMDFHLSPEANHGRGFVVCVLTDMSPEAMKQGCRDHFVAGIMYREKPKDNGLFINHCPWCGSKFDIWKEGADG
jgi:hypothetical protein